MGPVPLSCGHVSVASGQDGLALIGFAAYADNDIPVRLLPFEDTLNRNAAADRDRANHVRSPPLQDFRIVPETLKVN
ncbi:hypothetical protein PDE01_35520 [Paracoccus denitrificans]|nr:hypothetical protein PDE01_35520 [Paracoccus denitrificans]